MYIRAILKCNHYHTKLYQGKKQHVSTFDAIRMVTGLLRALETEQNNEQFRLKLTCFYSQVVRGSVSVCCVCPSSIRLPAAPWSTCAPWRCGASPWPPRFPRLTPSRSRSRRSERRWCRMVGRSGRSGVRAMESGGEVVRENVPCASDQL